MGKKSKVKEGMIKRFLDWFFSSDENEDEKIVRFPMLPPIHLHFHLNYYKVKGEKEHG